jgi:ribosomal-protein-alanine N-acetyltransferase
MSAVPREARRLVAMGVASLDEVLAIETAAYAFPWTRGNFVDSLASGYAAMTLHDTAGTMLGYFIAMSGVDEMHLLNLTVAPAQQHRGHARFMLDELELLCRERQARQLWLEVRESNQRARAIYRQRGFRHVGLRKGYYPAPAGQREDAIVMSLPISSGGGDGWR